MAQVLHKRAKTTHAIRKDIQRSSASLSRRYNLNPKTVRKWRYHHSVEDERMGPKQPLTDLEEAAAITFRRTTWLALDDCLFSLQRFIPYLTRSSLHRLYACHGISQIPRQPQKTTDKPSFKHYSIGYLHIDICEVRTREGKAYLFVAVDRTSKFVHARLYRIARREQAAEFLEDTLQQLPYRIHTVLTDNGVQFAKRRGTEYYKTHSFDVFCHRYGTEHRLTRPFHPWTNGQVERMNRTIKEATVRSFHYATLSELSTHLEDYLCPITVLGRCVRSRAKHPLASSSNVGRMTQSDSINIPSITSRDHTPRFCTKSRLVDSTVCKLRIPSHKSYGLTSHIASQYDGTLLAT